MIVKTYSRQQFFEHINYSEHDYYICIHPSGGPDSVPLFSSDLPNVLNTSFDDVLRNERKWGNDVGHYFEARAITMQQADEIVKFIDTIPDDATVHIHCVYGVSRTGSVARFLFENRHAQVDNLPLLGENDRVTYFLKNSKNGFLRLVNIDTSSLAEYYYQVLEKYQHLKWTNVSEVVDSELHKIEGVYGWGIQSNLADITQPCPPYDIHKDRSKVYADTELVFGFAKHILDRFPYARQLSLAGHPPGTKISHHVDNAEFIKVHIPINTCNNSWFVFDNNYYELEAGQAYLVDTRYSHGTTNGGTQDRVHFFFKIPVDKIEEFINDTLY